MNFYKEQKHNLDNPGNKNFTKFPTLIIARNLDQNRNSYENSWGRI